MNSLATEEALAAKSSDPAKMALTILFTDLTTISCTQRWWMWIRFFRLIVASLPRNLMLIPLECMKSVRV